MESRPLARGGLNVPTDLAREGIGFTAPNLRELGFYTLLTQEQVAKARTEEGLSYRDMNREQRRWVGQVAAALRLPSGRLAQASYRLEEHAATARRGTVVRLSFCFSGQTHSVEFFLPHRT